MCNFIDTVSSTLKPQLNKECELYIALFEAHTEKQPGHFSMSILNCNQHSTCACVCWHTHSYNWHSYAVAVCYVYDSCAMVILIFAMATFSLVAPVPQTFPSRMVPMEFSTTFSSWITRSSCLAQSQKMLAPTLAMLPNSKGSVVQKYQLWVGGKYSTFCLWVNLSGLLFLSPSDSKSSTSGLIENSSMSGWRETHCCAKDSHLVSFGALKFSRNRIHGLMVNLST